MKQENKQSCIRTRLIGLHDYLTNKESETEGKKHEHPKADEYKTQGKLVLQQLNNTGDTSSIKME